jgi:hypothetical protein
MTRRCALVAVHRRLLLAARRRKPLQMELYPRTLKRTLEEYLRAEIAFQKGDAQPFKDICSHADDATIMGGMGGIEKGWARVEMR